MPMGAAVISHYEPSLHSRNRTIRRSLRTGSTQRLREERQMGLLYHTLTDIQRRSSKHLLPDSHRLIWSLIADAIADGWPTKKTLDAGRSHPKETARAAFRYCGCEMVIPDFASFFLPTISSSNVA